MVERLLDILLPNGGYAMALVEAYFDESGVHDSPFLCIAGYIFEKENGVKLEAEWREMLARYQLPFFRMSSCNSGTGAFSHLDKDQRIAAQTEAIALIKKYMARGFVVSIDMGFADLIPSEGLFKEPYSFACWHALMGVRAWANDNQFEGDIAYFFEAGATGQSEANRLMGEIFANAELRKAYRYSSHSFIDKEKMAGTQCADILSWHCHKHLVRQMNGNNAARSDFLALIEGPHFATHYNEQKLRELRALHQSARQMA